jgi:hypothetical protein
LKIEIPSAHEQTTQAEEIRRGIQDQNGKIIDKK